MRAKKYLTLSAIVEDKAAKVEKCRAYPISAIFARAVGSPKPPSGTGFSRSFKSRSADAGVFAVVKKSYPPSRFLM